MSPRICCPFVSMCVFLLAASWGYSADPPDRTVRVWPDLAPGETTLSPGQQLPRREGENPPATRITGITQPLLEVYEPEASLKNGTAVLIFPGGGYNYVVRDKEGSEIARWLNGLGVTGIVVRYRTKDGTDAPLWQRPLQDGQRSLSLVRANAKQWGIDPERIGVLGFSAGGQAAALMATRFQSRAYPSSDDIDAVSCRPDFAMLVYPWKLVDADTGQLIDALTITRDAPPTFLVHAHNDHATSLSSVYFYARLRENHVPAELHIYENGGHGFGLRPVEGSEVATWPDRAASWLRLHSLAAPLQQD